MIRNAKALTEIRRSWNGVEALRRQLQRSAAISTVAGGMFPHALADAAHNLPFIHACAVLNEALIQLAREGRISCSGISLGDLVKAGAKRLRWKNLEVIRSGIRKRNAVAHRGKLLPRADCWTYVDAIERELRGWGIVT